MDKLTMAQLGFFFLFFSIKLSLVSFFILIYYSWNARCYHLFCEKVTKANLHTISTKIWCNQVFLYYHSSVKVVQLKLCFLWLQRYLLTDLSRVKCNMFFDCERSIYEERRGIGVTIESYKVPISHISKWQRPITSSHTSKEQKINGGP